MLCSQYGEWLDKPRSKHGCTRIDIPPAPWDVDAKALRRGGWMGRSPLHAKTKELCDVKVNPAMPFEEPEDGCPGGWYRSQFVVSLLPYMRTRAEGGARNSNPLLDRCDDELVVQLVMYLEHEQERQQAWREEQASGDQS